MKKGARAVLMAPPKWLQLLRRSPPKQGLKWSLFCDTMFGITALSSFRINELNHSLCLIYQYLMYLAL